MKILFFIYLFLISCSTGTKKNLSDSQKTRQIENTYWKSDKDEGKRIFKNGKYEFESLIGGEHCATCLEKAEIKKIVFGDLSGTDGNDAVAIIYSETGGSGTFVYLNLYLKKNGTMEQSGFPIFLGDRVRVEKLAIKDRKVIVKMITHGAGEPLCCPSTKETRHFKVENGQLKKSN